MMRKYHVRFGGGRLEKEPKRHLVSRLPYQNQCQAEGLPLANGGDGYGVSR